MWNRLTLECGHTLYVRLQNTGVIPNVEHHYAMCPKCQQDKKKNNAAVPTSWQAITSAVGATEDEVRDVSGWTDFLMPRNIMRDSPQIGVTFPYRGAGA